MTDTVIYIDKEKIEDLRCTMAVDIDYHVGRLMTYAWKRRVLGVNWRRHALDVSDELHRMVRSYRVCIARVGCDAPEECLRLRSIESGDSAGCTTDEVVFMDIMTAIDIEITLDSVGDDLYRAQACALRKDAAGLCEAISSMTTSYMSCMGTILSDELFA